MVCVTEKRAKLSNAIVKGQRKMVRRSLSILLIAMSLVVLHCPDPESSEQTVDWFMVPFLSQLFTDNGNATISDSNTNLMWMKCTYGQVWNASLNNCAGTGTATTYGAESLAFCELLTGFFTDCTDDNPIGPLAISGPAFNACNALDLGGHTDWRLPTKYEFQLLSLTLDDTSFSYVFPETPDDKYFWSGSGNEAKTDGSEANGVSFAPGSFGQMLAFNKKDMALYVRCVRNK